MFLRAAVAFVFVAAAVAAQEGPAPLGPGDHTRTLTVGGLKRTYLVHVPKSYDPKAPTPVVLALHGAAMTGPMMAWFSGLNATADAKGFIVVYPNGTGAGPLLTWNAGGFSKKFADSRPDDVEFLGKALDDLGTVLTVDPKRTFACGMSNGGMMCYRLAAELSDRIAAVAPVAGTIAVAESNPKRPVPVLHIHGAADAIVPYARMPGAGAGVMSFKGVEESVETWVKLNACDATPTTDTLTKADDPMPVTRKVYGGGKGGAEVVLVVVVGGGHTWPGQPTPTALVGRSTTAVSANELMWEFFQRHPLR